MDFLKSGSSQRLNRLLNENETHGMLEAPDFDSIDNVFSVFGGLADSLCDPTTFGKTNSALNEYVDMVNYLCKRHKSFEWCDGSLWHLQTRGQTFKKPANAAFEMYKASKMPTQKWHVVVVSSTVLERGRLNARVKPFKSFVKTVHFCDAKFRLETLQVVISLSLTLRFICRLLWKLAEF